MTRPAPAYDSTVDAAPGAPAKQPPSVAEAARTGPESIGFPAAIDRLAGLDAASWRELLPALERIADELAPSFRDVSTRDDLLGDLALSAHETWIADWLLRAREGRARGPLALFLRDRMRDQLREERRRRIRRAALLDRAPPPDGAPESEEGPVLLASSPFPSPDESVAANELRERVSEGSPALGTLLAMREAGLDRDEIARRTSTSKATVARRIAAIGAILAPLLGAVLIIALQHGGPVGSRPMPSAAPAIAPPIAPEPPMMPVPAVPPGAVPAPAPVLAPPVAAEGATAAAEAPVAPTTEASAAQGGTEPAGRGEGFLLVNSMPWARVFLDGRPIGTTPIVQHRVAPGRHVLYLETERGRSATRAIRVRDGETVRVVLDLSAPAPARFAPPHAIRAY
jgi:hypothetical protein